MGKLRLLVLLQKDRKISKIACGGWEAPLTSPDKIREGYERTQEVFASTNHEIGAMRTTLGCGGGGGVKPRGGGNAIGTLNEES